MEKYGTARQATDDNIIRRMRFACWITKATHTHISYLLLLLGNSGYANAPLCYVIRTLSLVRPSFQVIKKSYVEITSDRPSVT
jgi:hypothetical protein